MHPMRYNDYFIFMSDVRLNCSSVDGVHACLKDIGVKMQLIKLEEWSAICTGSFKCLQLAKKTPVLQRDNVTQSTENLIYGQL